MRILFLDTETTGRGSADRIISLGIIEAISNQITGRGLHLYFSTNQKVHPEAFKVHGLSNDFLKQYKPFKEHIPEIIRFIQGGSLIIHNARFDNSFLSREFKEEGYQDLEQYCEGIIDTLAMARELFPKKRNSLDALCARYNIDNSQRTKHCALLDASLLSEVYFCLIRDSASSNNIEIIKPPSEPKHIQRLNQDDAPNLYGSISYEEHEHFIKNILQSPEDDKLLGWEIQSNNTGKKYE